jgi:hypothetical protein
LGGAGMNFGFVGAAASALANHGQRAAVEVSTGELASPVWSASVFDYRCC